MKETIYIYGKHTVLAALENKKDCVDRIFLSEKYENDEYLQNLIKTNNIKTEKIDKNNLPNEIISEIGEFGSHQGLVARIFIKNLVLDGKEFLKSFVPKQNSVFLILGEITDTQNVGAILRSAAAFGVSGVIIPEHGNAPINAVSIKISAGGAFLVPILSVGNINQIIQVLKEKRFWIYGLSAENGSTEVFKEKFTEPSVFVIGNEHDGVREKTKEHCDILLSIPIKKESESLNAATSTSIALYEFTRQNYL